MSEVVKRETHSGRRPELSFVRTGNGVEVDLTLDRGTWRAFMEIKNTSTSRPELLNGVRSLKGRADKGLLLYRGKSIECDESLQVMNFSDYLLGGDGR